jgi:uncharacterized membrane protein (DUF485 family)
MSSGRSPFEDPFAPGNLFAWAIEAGLVAFAIIGGRVIGASWLWAIAVGVGALAAAYVVSALLEKALARRLRTLGWLGVHAVGVCCWFG